MMVLDYEMMKEIEDGVRQSCRGRYDPANKAYVPLMTSDWLQTSSYFALRFVAVLAMSPLALICCRSPYDFAHKDETRGHVCLGLVFICDVLGCLALWFGLHKQNIPDALAVGYGATSASAALVLVYLICNLICSVLAAICSKCKSKCAAESTGD
jgi:hypothetical protein